MVRLLEQLLLLTACLLVFSHGTHAATYDDQEIIFIQRLTLENPIYFELAGISGDYTSGQLAATSDGLVVGGSNGAFLLNLNSTNGQPPFLVSDDPDMFFISDLRSNNIVAFGNSEGTYLDGPGYLHNLFLFDATIPSNVSIVALNQSIFVGLNSAVFAGYGHFILMDGARKAFYSVDTETGEVVSITGGIDRWQQTYGWIATGVAEFFTFENVHLLYANQEGKVEQQNIGDGSNKVEKVYTDIAFESLSSIAISPAAKQWAFHATGSTPFGSMGLDSLAGVADGHFIEAWPTSQPSSRPTSQPSSRPTSQPSSQPSRQPTSQPTSHPTVQPGAAKVIRLALSSRGFNITANVTLDSNAKYAGTVYCAPFLANTQVTSVSQIVSSGSAVEYPAYTTRLRVAMRNLVPQTTYDVYCYVVNVLGESNSLSVVLNTKTTIATTCCRQAPFTNIPAFIYADLSRYSVNTPVSEYTFMFTLSHLPRRNVTFSPRIFNATAPLGAPSTVNGIEISPGSFRFLNTSSPNSLTCSFVLLISNPNLSGTVGIYLSLIGVSRFDYSPPPSFTFRILGTADAPPAPVFRSAFFSNQGNSMFMSFDSPTNLGQKLIGRPWTCSDLFDFRGNSVTSCVWLNTTFVEGVFGSVSDTLLPRIGSRIMLKANVLQTACLEGAVESSCAALPYASARNISLQSPVTPLVPNAVLSVPNSIGSCDNLTVNPSLTTGHGGRNWTRITWSVSSLDSGVNTAAVSSYLNARSSNKTSLRTIVVPRSLLTSALYSITLRVTNFLSGFHTVTSSVQVTDDAFKPRLSILGSTTLSMTAQSSLTIPSRAQFSTCTPANATTLSFSWTVQNVVDNTVLSTIVSRSSDPSAMLLPSYSLVAGQVYRMTVNCSASKDGFIVGMSSAAAQVSVLQGKIIAVIAGGSARQVPINMNVSLDASSSYDENIATKTHLQYSWSCFITSLGKLFGQDCSSVLAQTKQETALIVGGNLNVSLSYSLQVIVSAPNGRSGTSQVALSAQTAGSPYTELLVTSAKFNTDQNLSLSGLAQSSFDSTLLWTMSISQQNVSAASYTPLLRSYSANFMGPTVVSSILLAANSFAGGTQITFRLTATSTNSGVRTGKLPGLQAAATVSSFSEVTLIANIPPVGGTFTVSPSVGFALGTVFTLESLGWIDDPADYPLSYDFRFSTSTQSNALTIQSKSLSNIASTEFPAGIQAFNNFIVTFARIYDIFDASANANAATLVLLDPNLDVSRFLLDRLTSSLNSGSVDLGLQAVNNVVSTLNVVNCSAATNSYCRNLNRNPCSVVPNTCGPCLDAYIGVAGPANTVCLLANSSQGSVGDNCTSNSECILGLCADGKCAAPMKKCPSDNADTCSGNGQCFYRDVSGNLIDNSTCVESNVFCSARCECNVGFTGSSCALTPEVASQRDRDRGLMCSGLNNISSIGDASGSLLESLAGSLSAVFVATEVNSDSTTSICQNSLGIVSNLALQGFISSSSPDTGLFLIRSVSAFVKYSSNDSTNGKVVSDSLTDITAGLLSGMTNGQTPIDLIADNVQITLRNDLYLDVANSRLSPPPTSAESQYGALPLSVELDEGTASACSNDESFVQLTVMKWSSNPYANSSDVLSPILRLGSSGSSGSSSRARLNADMRLAVGDNAERHRSLMDDSSGYIITLQFSLSQNFNLSISPEEARKLPPNNFTFPDCTFQNGETYSACVGCNVSTYTNYNVSYICKDPSQICGQSSNSKLFSYHHGPVILADDDGVSTGQGMSMAQYGALFSAIKGVLLNTLSTNPFDVNIEEAKVILSLVGSIVLIFCGGCFVFSQWDMNDKLQLIYSKRWPPKSSYKRDVDVDTKKKSLLGWIDFNLLGGNRNMGHKASASGNVPVSSANSLELSQEDGNPVAPLLDKLVSGANSFFDATFPEFTRQRSWYTFMQIVVRRHDYLTCFFSPSLTNGRLLRWIGLWKSILIGLFVDTIFFSVFYSNDGSCETYSTQSTCELGINSITSEPTCEWTPKDDGGSCELREPPSDIMFTMSLALICVIVGVPIDMLFSFILDEYASKRPQLEQIELDSQYWLGTSTALNNLKTTEELNDNDPLSWAGELSVLGKEFRAAEKAWPEQTKSLVQAGEYTAQPIYARYHTPQEELECLIRIVQAHFAEHDVVDSRATSLEVEIQGELYKHRSDTLRLLLGINPDGSLQSLYPWEYLIYRSSLHKLLHRLKRIKRRQADVSEAVEAASSLSADAQEVTLMQYFVLEQFTSFQKWILRNQLFSFEAFSPEEIDAGVWIAAWVFVIGSLIFYVYWILAWGVSSGNAMLRAWGLNFIIGAIQDIFFVQVAKLFILYAVAVFTIRPQLQSMRMILQSQALSYMSGNLPPRKLYTYLMHARELDTLNAKPGVDAQVKELRLSMSTFRVIQQYSPACRAAWFANCQHLGVAKLLKNLDDADALQFAYIRNSHAGLYAVLLAGLPFQIYALFGDSAGDVLVDFLLPTVSSFFVVANALLSKESVVAMLCIYIPLAVYAIYQSGLWKGATRYVRDTRYRSARVISSSQSNPSFPVRSRRSISLLRELTRWAHASLMNAGASLHSVTINPFAHPVAFSSAEEKCWKTMNLPCPRLCPSFTAHTTPASPLGMLICPSPQNGAMQLTKQGSLYLGSRSTFVDAIVDEEQDSSRLNPLPREVLMLRSISIVHRDGDHAKSSTSSHDGVVKNIEAYVGFGWGERFLQKKLQLCSDLLSPVEETNVNTRSGEHKGESMTMHKGFPQLPPTNMIKESLPSPQPQHHQIISPVLGETILLTSAQLSRIMMVEILRVYLRNQAPLLSLSHAHSDDVSDAHMQTHLMSLAEEIYDFDGTDCPPLSAVELVRVFKSVLTNFPLHSLLPLSHISDLNKVMDEYRSRGQAKRDDQDTLSIEEIEELASDFALFVFDVKSKLLTVVVPYVYLVSFIKQMCEKILVLMRRADSRVYMKSKEAKQEKIRIERLSMVEEEKENEEGSDEGRQSLGAWLSAGIMQLMSNVGSQQAQPTQSTPLPAIVPPRLSQSSASSSSLSIRPPLAREVEVIEDVGDSDEEENFEYALDIYT